MSYCINCGNKVGEDYDFCPSCGKKIKSIPANSSKERNIPPSNNKNTAEPYSKGIKIFNVISILIIILSTYFPWISFSVSNKKYKFDVYGIANISSYLDIKDILLSVSKEWNMILALPFLYYLVPIVSIIVLAMYVMKIRVKGLLTIYDILLCIPLAVTVLIKFTFSSKGISAELCSGFYIFLVFSVIISFTLNSKKNQ